MTSNRRIFWAYFLILIVEKHSYYNFAFKLQKTYADTNGRFIICDIEIEKKYITVANVHALATRCQYSFKISLLAST